MNPGSPLPFRVTCFDPAKGRRVELGRASDRDSAGILVEGGKAQSRGLRDFHIDNNPSDQLDLFKGD